MEYPDHVTPHRVLLRAPRRHGTLVSALRDYGYEVIGVPASTDMADTIIPAIQEDVDTVILPLLEGEGFGDIVRFTGRLRDATGEGADTGSDEDYRINAVFTDLPQPTADRSGAAYYRDAVHDACGGAFYDDATPQDILAHLDGDLEKRQDNWLAVKGVGPVNGRLLAAHAVSPETATYPELEDALIEGYTQRLGDELAGQQIGRAQAKRVRTYNPDRF